MSLQHQPLATASPPDPDSLTYTVQHQVLGSDQWTALATGLREPRWAATGLRKGLQHVFRVLSTTGKSSSKPSPPSEPTQLLEHGEQGTPKGRAEGRLNDHGRNGVTEWDPGPSVAAGPREKAKALGQTSCSLALALLLPGCVPWTKD